MKHKESSQKEKSILASKKAAGTVKKIIEMLEEDRYCIDIIQQIDGAIGLLKSARNQILDDHFDHCLLEKIQEDKEKTLDELKKVYRISN
ncbi:MAG: metal-sensitive transcriptional regulator [Candidatus Dojkabacteria bacterium]|nr:metal-sensitive transcriptional regulator [Candidatus Dojkabacteria bacterium]